MARTPSPLKLHRKQALSDPRHLMRFLKSEAKVPLEDIAKAEGVSLTTVRESVRMVENYRAQNSTSQMDFAIREMIVSAMPRAKQTLEGLLMATELVQLTDPKTGKTKHLTREDKTTRIEAMRIVTDIIGKVQPKAPLAEVNVNQNMQIANLSAGETTEERMDRLRKKAEAHNLLPPEVAAVPTTIDRELEADEEEEDGEEGEEEDNE